MQTFARSQGCKRRSRNCLALLPIRGPVGKYRATDMLVTCRSQPLRGGKHGAFDPESRSVEFYAAEVNDLGPLAVSSAMNLAKSAVELANPRKPTSESPHPTFSSAKAPVLSPN